MSVEETDLVEVRLVGLPVEIHRRAAEHSDELQREFTLLQASSEAGSDVPARLLSLIGELRSRYAGFTANPQQELIDAMERQVETIDLVYQVPRDVRDATVRLGELLDAADDFCRSGQLMTLATPAEALAYRRWYLNEFVRQADGLPPTPWAAAVEAEPDGA